MATKLHLNKDGFWSDNEGYVYHNDVVFEENFIFEASNLKMIARYDRYYRNCNSNQYSLKDAQIHLNLSIKFRIKEIIRKHC